MNDNIRNSLWKSASALLIGTFALLTTLYSVINPLWEAPDEVGHFFYVSHLVQHRSLPVQQIGHLGEAHQPPLYYALVALAIGWVDLVDIDKAFVPNHNFMWAGQGGNDRHIAIHGSEETFPFEGWSLGFHLARGVSVVMATLTVGLVIAIGRMVLPDQRWLILAITAFIAFNPQFLFISSAVNNDNLLTMATTGGLWQLLRVVKAPDRWRGWAGVGIWVGVALLAKPGGVVLAGLASLVVLGCAVRAHSWRILLQGVLGLAIPLIVLTGWWFFRNYQLYGDLLGWGMYEQVFGVNLRKGGIDSAEFYNFLDTQFRSFWGMFGWMNLPSPRWFDRFVRLITTISLLGWILLILFWKKRPIPQFSTTHLTLLGGAILIQQSYLIALIMKCNASCYQGRYLFPMMAPLMIFLVMGLLSIAPRPINQILIVGAISTLFYAALTFPFQLIKPTYASVPISKWEARQIEQPLAYDFSGQFELRGYEIERNTDHLQVTLYWQATQKPTFDYSSFVHLIDEEGTLITQDDHAPGDDRNYLPTQWLQGDIVADPHFLPLLSTDRTAYRLRIGLYDWSSGEQLMIRETNLPFILLDIEE